MLTLQSRPRIFDDRGERDAEAETEPARCAVSPDCSRVLFGSEMPWGVRAEDGRRQPGASAAAYSVRGCQVDSNTDRVAIAASGARPARAGPVHCEKYLGNAFALFHSCFWVRYMLGRDRRPKAMDVRDGMHAP